MIQPEQRVLIRIFLEESYRYHGKPTYQALLSYMRDKGYAGATVIRGIEGFGRSHKMHTADILELSTDLPIIVEVIETPEQAEKLKQELAESGMINSGLLTEEKVSVYRFKEK